MKKNLKTRQAAVLGTMGLMMVLGFQNCSSQNFSPASSDNTGASQSLSASSTDSSTDQGTPAQPGDPTPDPDQLVCNTQVNTKAIVFDSAQPNAPVTANFTWFAGQNAAVQAQTVDTVSGVIANNITATAATINHVEGFTGNLVTLNAKSIGDVQWFTAKEIDITAHTLDTVSNFAAGICVSAQTITNMSNLIGKVTLYGRTENGVRSSITNPLQNMASYMAVYDFDIATVQNNATKAKFVNSHIGHLQGTWGNIVLVNSKIDDISQFAGTIHLRGNSTVGSVTNSHAHIVQDSN